jgi:hypothetical protein
MWTCLADLRCPVQPACACMSLPPPVCATCHPASLASESRKLSFLCLSAVCIVTIKHTARQTQISNEWQGMRERVVAGNASAAKRTGIMNRWPPQLGRNGQKPCCVWLCELCSAGALLCLPPGLFPSGLPLDKLLEQSSCLAGCAKGRLAAAVSQHLHSRQAQVGGVAERRVGGCSVAKLQHHREP